MQVTPSIAGIDTTFISFGTSSGSAGVVTIFTTSNTKVDSYNVTIIGNLYAV